MRRAASGSRGATPLCGETHLASQVTQSRLIALLSTPANRTVLDESITELAGRRLLGMRGDHRQRYLNIDLDGLQMFGSASPVTLFYDAVAMGTVGFMQPLEIPSGSTLIVQLQDTSLQDVAAKVLGETVITDFSVIPIPFSVSYDPTVIDARFTYSISARITDEAGNLIFINTTAFNVITNGNPSIVEVIVEPV